MKSIIKRIITIQNLFMNPLDPNNMGIGPMRISPPPSKEPFLDRTYKA